MVFLRKKPLCLIADVRAEQQTWNLGTCNAASDTRGLRPSVCCSRFLIREAVMRRRRRTTERVGLWSQRGAAPEPGAALAGRPRAVLAAGGTSGAARSVSACPGKQMGQSTS